MKPGTVVRINEELMVVSSVGASKAVLIDKDGEKVLYDLVNESLDKYAMENLTKYNLTEPIAPVGKIEERLPFLDNWDPGLKGDFVYLEKTDGMVPRKVVSEFGTYIPQFGNQYLVVMIRKGIPVPIKIYQVNEVASSQGGKMGRGYAVENIATKEVLHVWDKYDSWCDYHSKDVSNFYSWGRI